MNNASNPDFSYSVFKPSLSVPELVEKGLLFNPEHIRLFEALYIEAAQQKLSGMAPMDTIKRAEFDADMEQLTARMQLINELVGYHNIALQNFSTSSPAPNTEEARISYADQLARREF